MPKKIGKLHYQIVDVLEKEPSGLTVQEIRDRLPSDIGPQQHFDKRIRELYYAYNIVQENNRYYYHGKKALPLDNQGISSKLRAAVINMAHGRCQMCGRTVAEDNIKLQADHKIPHNWGGPTTLENLWAICGLCNGGKRDFFKSFDDSEMKELVTITSVHARLAHALRDRPDPVPSWFLEFVANVNDFQDDWKRRLRELRLLGIDYSFAKKRLKSGKVETKFQLTKWTPLPDDPTGEVRRIEQEKARRRQRREEDENDE